ncbi:MAG: hypothetical protein ABIQ86_16530 [Steroidobacteraceae bacterium]
MDRIEPYDNIGQEVGGYQAGLARLGGTPKTYHIHDNTAGTNDSLTPLFASPFLKQPSTAPDFTMAD